MTQLREVMSPIRFSCDREERLFDLAGVLHQATPLPVAVMNAGALVGAIEAADLVRSPGRPEVTVGEIAHKVGVLDVGRSLDDAAEILANPEALAVVVQDGEQPVGIVARIHLLAEVGRNVLDKAPMKILSGHRDLGFNVPISPCQRNCPIKQDIATYIDYVSQGRYIDSWMVIHETNPIPSILGRLCNHPCETDCKRGWDAGEDPVTIRSIKRFATDAAFNQGLWINYKRAPSKGKKVAVVGGGPAGLTCALDLQVSGYDVALYERESKVGGLLSTSIPPFRFDHRQLEWELEMILATGIETHCDSPVGTGPSDTKVEELLEKYDAVFVSIGMMKGRILPVPGTDALQVTDAMSFLREISYDRVPKHFPVGGTVVVVGGGAVATDACQSSIKLGAKEVWMCAIEPEDHLPAFGNELHEAKEIGLKIKTGILVKEILKNEKGDATGVAFAPLQTPEFDPLSGKLIFASVKEIEGAERAVVEGDYVIFASGQIMEGTGDPLPLTQRGLVAADRGGHTSVSKLFAGGDCVQGPSFIVDAVAWGHRTARSMREFLGEDIDNENGDRLYQTVVERTDDHRMSESFARTDPAILEAAKRYDMTEVEQSWSDREAVVQAIRCFQCDSVHHYDEAVCVLCGACDDVCPEKAIDVVVFGEDRERSSGGDTLVCATTVGNPRAEGVAGEIFINYDRCTNCRICEDHCPVNCITFERVRFTDDTMRAVERPRLKVDLPIATAH